MAGKTKKKRFILKNRYLVYLLILAGGITADIGVLIINSGKRVLSTSLIVIGGIVLFYSLYLVAQDRFYISSRAAK